MIYANVIERPLASKLAKVPMLRPAARGRFVVPLPYRLRRSAQDVRRGNLRAYRRGYGRVYLFPALGGAGCA